MKVALNVSLNQLEDKINRQIVVDENISLIDLCEFIIISMNGRKIPLYCLEYNKETYYPSELTDEKTLVNLTLKDLKLKKKNSFVIEYNFKKFYNFDVIVDDIFEETIYKMDEYFQVLSGKGCGIIDDVGGVWGLSKVISGSDTRVNII